MVDIPDKERKHKWVTEAIAAGEKELSVWPSPDEIKDKKKQDKFFDIIARVGSDPRVTKIEKRPHAEHGTVFIFHLNKDG